MWRRNDVFFFGPSCYFKLARFYNFFFPSLFSISFAVDVPFLILNIVILDNNSNICCFDYFCALSREFFKKLFCLTTSLIEILEQVHKFL